MYVIFDLTFGKTTRHPRRVSTFFYISHRLSPLDHPTNGWSKAPTSASRNIIETLWQLQIRKASKDQPQNNCKTSPKAKSLLPSTLTIVPDCIFSCIQRSESMI